MKKMNANNLIKMMKKIGVDMRLTNQGRDIHVWWPDENPPPKAFVDLLTLHKPELLRALQ